jgi:hypothetical protein
MKPQYALRPVVGHLKPDCQEAVWWSLAVGSLEVPLKSPATHLMLEPNATKPDRFYDVDIARLTDQQVEILCKIMAAKFDVPIREVRDGMRGEHGLPIRADRLTAVTFDGRHFL